MGIVEPLSEARNQSSERLQTHRMAAIKALRTNANTPLHMTGEKMQKIPEFLTHIIMQLITPD